MELLIKVRVHYLVNVKYKKCSFHLEDLSMTFPSIVKTYFDDSLVIEREYIMYIKCHT